MEVDGFFVLLQVFSNQSSTVYAVSNGKRWIQKLSIMELMGVVWGYYCHQFLSSSTIQHCLLQKSSFG